MLTAHSLRKVNISAYQQEMPVNGSVTTLMQYLVMPFLSMFALRLTCFTGEGSYL